MTNREIITRAAILAGVKEEAHTFYHWRESGYMVKKGEHASFVCPIWKKGKSRKDKKTGETLEGSFFLAPAHFFTRSQVIVAPAASPDLFLPVYDDAGAKLQVNIKKSKAGYNVFFPGVDEPCHCDDLETVQREITDFCDYACLRLALEDD